VTEATATRWLFPGSGHRYNFTRIPTTHWALRYPI